MAIKKKLIHFESFSNFNSQKLSANKNNTAYTIGVNGTVTQGEPNVLFGSICFIKDTQKIWTHGKLYDCASADLSDYLTSEEISSLYLTKVDASQTYLGKNDQAASAATADSVDWDNVDGRPTKLSGLEDDVVAGNYLPLSGGEIRGDLIIGNGDTKTWIHYFQKDINAKFGAIGVSSWHELLFDDITTVHTIIHSGNYSSYALPLSGGTMTGEIKFNIADLTYKDISAGIIAAFKAPRVQINELISNYIYLGSASEGSSSDSSLVIRKYSSITDKSPSGTTDLVTIDTSGNVTAIGGFTGNLTGTATKATQDGNGNVIADTYATKGEVNEKQDAVLKFTNLTASSWVSDSTYADYPYRCDLSCSGVTSSNFAEVVFGIEQALSGAYAPICETKTNVVSIWSSENTTTTIPTIIITK